MTRYHEGLHLSASFIVGRGGFLPLTINRQLINFEGEGISYQGSQVPYNTPRADEIWAEARKAAMALQGLRGYAGIDFVLGERPWAVDVNARPTTSIIGIARVMQEEIGEADTAGQVWRDAGGGACDRGVHVPEGRARLNFRISLRIIPLRDKHNSELYNLIVVAWPVAAISLAPNHSAGGQQADSRHPGRMR